MYGNVPDEVLDIELGECYTAGPYNLRNEIDSTGEEILHANWKIYKKDDMCYPKLESFIAWTENKVLVVIDSALGDKILLQLPRNPIIQE